MRSFRNLRTGKATVSLLLLLLLSGKIANAQDSRFGLYFSPIITWFSTNINEVSNKGARTGVNLNVSVYKRLSERFSAVAGISFINSSGRLVSSKPAIFKFPNYNSIVAAGNPIVYRLQYISIPVGLKFKTNEIGLFSYFAETGFDPKVVIRGRVDIPSIEIKNAKAMTEIKRFNLGWHLNAGIDYSLNGNSSLILGLGYERDFFDATKDVGDQEKDRASQNFLKFIFGLNF